MRQNSWLMGILVLVLLIGGSVWYMNRTSVAPSVEEGNVLYTNPTYNISFQYPDRYELREREVGTQERYHYSVTLIDKEAFPEIPQNGEGPPVIAVDVFQNDLDTLLIEQWVHGTNDSNFKLSPDDALTSTTVAGAPALSYTWDGLYRGKSVVLSHRDSIIVLSVQWLTEEDAIIKDFADLLTSLELN